MELQTADTNATAALKVSRCLVTTGQKSDAFKGRAVMCGDAQRGQILPCIRHKALAAGLIDGWPLRVGDKNIHAFLPQCDGGRKACGTATDDERITVHRAFGLPLQQQHLRAESRAHRGQDAVRSRLGAAMGHDFIEHHQHRSRGEIAHLLQCFPGKLQFAVV